jgi:hypothetical protein
VDARSACSRPPHLPSDPKRCTGMVPDRKAVADQQASPLLDQSLRLPVRGSNICRVLSLRLGLDRCLLSRCRVL